VPATSSLGTTHRKLATILVSAILALCGCRPQGSEGTISDAPIGDVQSETFSRAVASQTIDLANAQASGALVRADVDAAIANYAANATGITHNDMRWSNSTELKQVTSRALGRTRFTYAAKNTESLLVSGDIVVETGSASLAYVRRGGHVITTSSKYLAVWMRQLDGSLKIVRELSSAGARVE
jgi:ketosteroid isomerase-like protein